MNPREHSFFNCFPESAAEQLWELAQPSEIDGGEVLFEEGDSPDGIYLVVEGRVEFWMRGIGHSEVLIATAGPNDFFGEMAVLTGQGRSARVVATESTKLLLIPRDPFLKILTSDPGRSSLQLMRHIINYVHAVDHRLMVEMMDREKMTLVGETAGRIMHDLRAPLTGIRLAAGRLGMIHEDAETQRLCQMMDLQVDRMQQMVQELLDFARGDAHLDKQAVDLSELVEQVLLLERESFPTVEMMLEAVPVETPVDRSRLTRVVHNLVRNAAEAAGPNGGQLKITILLRDNEVWLTIDDSGPGLPEDIIETIFQPFVTHGKANGTGLGLAIVDSLMRAHGGSVTAKAHGELGGASFCLRLPVSA